MALDNLRGGTKRVVEENTPLNNLRGGTKRVVIVNGGGGGGGGDQHNLGYYATQAALEEAHPTAEAGDWAIVGATDTVWIWDTDNSEWVDSDQKGQVTSVNGQTGDVTLTIPDAVQYSTMPTASADNLGDIIQFTGTTDANYTNGYFYKCVSDGQDPATYTWEAVEVQASSGGLPSQAGNAGKFLTTDGTSASWGSEVKPFVIKSTTATTFDEILVLKSSDEIAEYNTHISHGHYGGLYITESSFNNGWVISNASIKPYKNIAGSIGIYNGHVETVYANYLSSATSYAESTTNRISVPNTSGTMVVATPPSADGTYVLKATVADGVVTTTWVAE